MSDGGENSPNVELSRCGASRSSRPRSRVYNSLMQQYALGVLLCARDGAENWAFSKDQHKESPNFHGTCILEGRRWVANRQIDT